MGSYSYDRDVYSSSSYSNWGSSSYSASKLSSDTLDDSVKPNGKKIKSSSKNPIIIVLDVTGSNINFARLVYDKLPMFYGEIEQKGYLSDFDICVCAVGDASCGSYPIQIGTPAKGLEIDSWMEKLVLESGANEVALAFGLTKVAALAYLMFNLFTPPCFAAIGAMNAEIQDKKWLFGGIGLQFATGYTVAFLVYQIGTLITTGQFGQGFVAGLIVVIAIVAFIVGLIKKTDQKFASEYKLK